MLLSLVAAVQGAGGRPDVSSVLINPRHALAFGAAIVASLLLLQYGHRRKPFILIWATGFLLIAPAMLLVAGSYGNPMVGALALGLSRLLGVYTAALFLWSADVFRQTGFVRPNRLKLLIVAAVWFLLSVAAGRDHRPADRMPRPDVGSDRSAEDGAQPFHQAADARLDRFFLKRAIGNAEVATVGDPERRPGNHGDLVLADEPLRQRSSTITFQPRSVPRSARPR